MKALIATAIIALALTSFGVYKLVEPEHKVSVSTYADRLRLIANEVNASNTTWKAEHYDRWNDYTEGEVKAFLGSKPKTAEKRAELKKLRKTFDTNSLMAEEVPESFDSRTQWPKCESLLDIRDQSKCGSCWAISSAAAMSDRLCIASGQTDQRRISAADPLACVATENSEGCNGGQEDEVFQFWKSRGFVTGNLYHDKTQWCKPYPFPPCAHHVTIKGMDSCTVGDEYPTPTCSETCDQGYNGAYKDDKIYAKEYNTFSGEADMMREISTNGPIVTGYTVYEDFMAYKGGVYQHIKGKQMGGHAVKIIGYGTDEKNVKYWLVSNSWNKYWGEEGHFRMIRGTNDCGFEEDAVSGIASVSKSVSA